MIEEVGDRFLMIRPCIVFGLMNGEAMEMANEGKLEFPKEKASIHSVTALTKEIDSAYLCLKSIKI
jgi:hypothetical protein